jgi:hypothetical protein
MLGSSPMNAEVHRTPTTGNVLWNKNAFELEIVWEVNS